MKLVSFKIKKLEVSIYGNLNFKTIEDGTKYPVFDELTAVSFDEAECLLNMKSSIEEYVNLRESRILGNIAKNYNGNSARWLSYADSKTTGKRSLRKLLFEIEFKKDEIKALAVDDIKARRKAFEELYYLEGTLLGVYDSYSNSLNGSERFWGKEVLNELKNIEQEIENVSADSDISTGYKELFDKIISVTGLDEMLVADVLQTASDNALDATCIIRLLSEHINGKPYVPEGVHWNGMEETIETMLCRYLTEQVIGINTCESIYICKYLQDWISSFHVTSNTVFLNGHTFVKKYVHLLDELIYTLDIATDKCVYYVGNETLLVLDFASKQLLADNEFALISYTDSVENIRRNKEKLLYGEIYTEDCEENICSHSTKEEHMNFPIYGTYCSKRGIAWKYRVGSDLKVEQYRFETKKVASGYKEVTIYSPIITKELKNHIKSQYGLDVR